MQLLIYMQTPDETIIDTFHPGVTAGGLHGYAD